MKRWRKEPRESGLRGIVQGTRGSEYQENGETMAWVRPVTAGLGSYEVTGWYWYGDGHNSYSIGVIYKTEKEAMAAVVAHFTSNPAEQETPHKTNKKD
jgi:hypothetical protein